jgi:hypothetical protein
MKRAAFALALALVAGPAFAKNTKPASQATHKAQATPVAERSPSASTNTTTSTTTSTSTSTSDGASTTTNTSGKTVKTKTYTFGAMDVEGKLKTPQLLYFLNRVKLELDMSAPDKRSFMKELERSADDKNL